MNRLILIRGPICSGKSTTASLLRKFIEPCSLIDQDSLKRAIDNQNPSEWRDKMAFDTTLYLADQLMEKRRDIIADIHSSIRRQYDNYKMLAQKYDYKLFSFLLYPPLNVCIERNSLRNIPDVRYKITEEEIRKYWENPYQVKDEIIFDSSTISPEEIVKNIIELVR